jgi:hypothetical protein
MNEFQTRLLLALQQAETVAEVTGDTTLRDVLAELVAANTAIGGHAATFAIATGVRIRRAQKNRSAGGKAAAERQRDPKRDELYQRAYDYLQKDGKKRIGWESLVSKAKQFLAWDDPTREKLNQRSARTFLKKIEDQ